ncbi:putative acyl-CoA dehydrogenase [Paraburkholderia piptadeniae]|uniref:Acyl-CoA dehydrogenase n=1 Tax=Paraburkholderia piptadeniae TaxID=1701573 RepID=A0A1N7SDZ3_9BURK|nr:acyl-CoA dehydrogenase family protein [Paraburkholderia piptadeniae]SIT45638.1 putative acyl-CoA dehydrogenase [Paraburkholderia piptadeniae]
MFIQYSPRSLDLQERLKAFMNEHIYPNEERYEDEMNENRRKGNPWVPSKLVEELKPKARDAGLWNLFLPHSERVPEGLSNLDYAPLCEIFGRVRWSSQVFNCSAPDTGNMETLERYASETIKRTWLDPLLRGEIRSAFAMTEPAVASSDATNIQSRIERKGDKYVINGRKWWTSGSADPRCKVFIFMGKTDLTAPRHRQQSMLVVPADTPGIEILRPLTVFGYDDAPSGHCEIVFENVEVPVENILLGEGRGFEIAQGRLGPGRIHHCMRSIGVAERALEYMCARLASRTAFGARLADQSVWHERVAESRCMIDQARLLVLHTAHLMDTVGNKVARKEIAMIKVVAPNVSTKVCDWAIQAHGGGGVSSDFPLADMWAHQRTIRFTDGPDEVHRNAIAKMEFKNYLGSASSEVEVPVTRGC